MFLEKEEEDIFTIILELYIMDFGISNDITDQRHVRVLHSLPNAHDYPSPRLKQATEISTTNFLTVLRFWRGKWVFPLRVNGVGWAGNSPQWRLFGIGMKRFPNAQTRCFRWVSELGSHFHFISACFHTASISNFQFNYLVNQWNHIL